MSEHFPKNKNNAEVPDYSTVMGGDIRPIVEVQPAFSESDYDQHESDKELLSGMEDELAELLEAYEEAVSAENVEEQNNLFNQIEILQRNFEELQKKIEAKYNKLTLARYENFISGTAALEKQNENQQDQGYGNNEDMLMETPTTPTSEVLPSALDTTEVKSGSDWMVRIEQIASLKAEIENINRLVRENKLNTTEADQRVALHEKHIRALETPDRLEEFTKRAVRIEQQLSSGELSEEDAREKIKKNEDKLNEIRGWQAEYEATVATFVPGNTADSIAKVDADLGRLQSRMNKGAVTTPEDNHDAKAVKSSGVSEEEDQEVAESKEVTEKVSEEVTESGEESLKQVEYLQAKQEFKQAQRTYFDTLKEQYRSRNIFSKMAETFGLGRKRAFTSAEQVAYDTYMAANKKFYKYGKDAGVYVELQQRLTDRSHRRRKIKLLSEYDKSFVVTPLVADRFIFNPADRRLEVQSGFLPEKLQQLKKRVLTRIKKHPYVSAGLAGALVTYGFTINAPGVLVGATSGFVGHKFVVGHKATQLNKRQEKTVTQFKVGNMPDLEQLEADYFTDARRLEISKNRNRAVSTTLGLTTAAAAESLFGDSQFISSNEIVNSTDPYADFPRADVNHPVSEIESVSEVASEISGISESVEFGRGELRPGLDSNVSVSESGAAPELLARETAPAPEAAPRSTPGVASQSSGDNVSPSVETGPQNPAPVKEVTISPVESVAEHATNQATISTPGEILAERSRVDLVGALERMHGYQPKITSNLEQLVTSPLERQPIIHHLYAEMIKAYDAGQFNLPAMRAEYVNHNPTALFSFIEENAKELTNNRLSAFLGGSDSLGLSPEEWRALGFSSGDPQVISPADKIQTGKLIKLILENVAEEMNSKFKP